MQEVPKPRKLLDMVSNALRVKHYAYRTEETYVHVNCVIHEES